MSRQILNRKVNVDGVEIFYREAGDKKNPALLLMHGFPSSSVIFKNLMVVLADKFHLVAPDYPGFGFSDFPDRHKFEYTFENIGKHIGRFTEEIGLARFAIYLHDYGAAVGLRVCLNHPEKIQGLIVQDGNSHMEGIGPEWDETRDYWENPTAEKKEKVYAFLSAEGTKWQDTAGVPEEMLDHVSPETWIVDWNRMSRSGNVEMQYELNCDYKTHIEMFPVYQEYFRKHQPPALVMWGKHDVFFSVDEAPAYKRELPDAEIHILDGGHHALETNFDEVSKLIEKFMTGLNSR